MAQLGMYLESEFFFNTNPGTATAIEEDIIVQIPW